MASESIRYMICLRSWRLISEAEEGEEYRILEDDIVKYTRHKRDRRARLVLPRAEEANLLGYFLTFNQIKLHSEFPQNGLEVRFAPLK